MSLTAFLKENVPNPFDEVDFVVSKRFRDENGVPVAWKLRAMNPEKSLLSSDNAMCIDRKGNADFKVSAYYKNIVVNSVVFPNLYDKSLQDSYNVMSPDDLLNVMLNSREFNRLLKKCQDINGLDKDFDILKDEVKN